VIGDKWRAGDHGILNIDFRMLGASGSFRPRSAVCCAGSVDPTLKPTHQGQGPDQGKVLQRGDFGHDPDPGS
jgi:hypothetical protein